MKAVRALLVTVLAAVLTFVGLSGQGALAAPYPPPVCGQLSVSTTTPYAGEAIVVSGTGFFANKTFDLVMRPDTTDLGKVTSNSGGSFSRSVTLPSGIKGSHYIYADGDVSACPVDPAPLEIQAAAAVSAPSSRGGLAFTGFDILGFIALALGLVGVGAVFARSGRRRRVRSSH